MNVVANGVSYSLNSLGTGNPLVLLHGFSGSSASWLSLADDLSEDHRVFAIDHIGHGNTEAPLDPSQYSYRKSVADLAAIADHLNIGPATWYGYSMGGRLALGLALDHPRLVSALVLESSSPGLASSGERKSRRAADEALARRIERDGIRSFVAAWERLPLWDSQRTLDAASRRHQRDIRLRNRPGALANSLRGMGQGAQPSLWPRLGELDVLVLLLAGELDSKFSSIANQMGPAIPRAEIQIVPDAGHNIHLERPDAVAAAVRCFLASGALGNQ